MDNEKWFPWAAEVNFDFFSGVWYVQPHAIPKLHPCNLVLLPAQGERHDRQIPFSKNGFVMLDEKTLYYQYMINNNPTSTMLNAISGNYNNDSYGMMDAESTISSMSAKSYSCPFIAAWFICSNDEFAETAFEGIYRKVFGVCTRACLKIHSRSNLAILILYICGESSSMRVRAASREKTFPTRFDFIKIYCSLFFFNTLSPRCLFSLGGISSFSSILENYMTGMRLNSYADSIQASTMADKLSSVLEEAYFQPTAYVPLAAVYNSKLNIPKHLVYLRLVQNIDFAFFCVRRGRKIGRCIFAYI